MLRESSVALADALVAFVCDLQLLDGDLVVARVGAGSSQLAWPGVNEVPAGDLGAVLAVHDDRAILAGVVDLALPDHLAPLPHIHRVGDAALERDIVPLHPPGHLLDDELTFRAAGLVLDDLVLAAQARALAESAHDLPLK